MLLPRPLPAAPQQSVSLFPPWALTATRSLCRGYCKPWVAANRGPTPSCGSPVPSSLSGTLMALLWVPYLFPQHPD